MHRETPGRIAEEEARILEGLRERSAADWCRAALLHPGLDRRAIRVPLTPVNSGAFWLPNGARRAGGHEIIERLRRFASRGQGVESL